MSNLIERQSAQPETHEERTETHECDLISRQAAIDAAIEAVDAWDGGYNPARMEMIEDAIRELPSAEPIIRCKECKHRDPEDRKCDCGHDILWQLPRQDDWYCADAERRTDE